MAHVLELMVLFLVGALLPLGGRAQGSRYGSPSYAQELRPGIELRGFAGYHVSSDLGFQSGSARVDGSPSYGAAIGARLRPGETTELLWVMAPTNAHFTSALGLGDASLTIHYFQLSGTQAFRTGRVEPYLTGSLGAALYSFGTLVLGGTRFEGSDVWRFAFTFGGGLKFRLVEAVAIQLEARMLAPVWFSSASLYSGPAGAAFAVSGGIPVVEGNFTGGLVLAL